MGGWCASYGGHHDQADSVTTAAADHDRDQVGQTATWLFQVWRTPPTDGSPERKQAVVRSSQTRPESKQRRSGTGVSSPGSQISERASKHDAAAQDRQHKETVVKKGEEARSKPEQESSQVSQHRVNRLKVANKPTHSRQRVRSSRKTLLLSPEVATSHHGIYPKHQCRKKKRDRQKQGKPGHRTATWSL